MVLSKFNLIEIENKIKDLWKKEEFKKLNYFDFNNLDKDKVLVIDTPPPFTSGNLHLGHVLNFTWIDFISRYKRAKGYNVLLPQGFDTQGLPTETKIEKEYKIPRNTNDPKELKEFIELAINWTKKVAEKMKKDFDNIAYSADWRFEYRTYEKYYHKAVQEGLIKLFKKGLLKREEHPVFYCPKCKTSLAKAETGYVEKEGIFAYLKLPLVEGKTKEGKDYLLIATTRPELMPACICVLVHPEDERYKDLIGSKVRIPLINREVPILADESVDKEFGTGAVYVCTYGDEMDVQWQKKFNLPVYKIIDENGRMVNTGIGEIDNLNVNEAKKKILEILEKEGFIEKVEKIKHRVLSHTERSSCMTPIELLPLKQWFITVRPFTKDIIKIAEKINWIPDHMFLRLKDWAESMDWDWLISRQRVFGTPIPFYVCKNCEYVEECKELPCDPRLKEKDCPKCGGKMEGVRDVCDVWVDSSITPLIVSNYYKNYEFAPDNLFDYAYPNFLRPQGTDIIRTWAFYTIFRTFLELKDKKENIDELKPWKEILINGMILGPDNRKMSKSLGNVINPDEVVYKYGGDTLRLWSLMGVPGEDYSFQWKDIEAAYRFLNKFYNLARLLQLNLEKAKEEGKEVNLLRNIDEIRTNFSDKLSELDIWLLSELDDLILKYDSFSNKYEFNKAQKELKEFLWEKFADFWVELSKNKLIEKNSVKLSLFYYVLFELTKLLSYMAPFTAEYIYQELFKDFEGKLSIFSFKFPNNNNFYEENKRKLFKIWREHLEILRKFKTSLGLKLKEEMGIIKLYTPNKKDIELIKEELASLLKAKDLLLEESKEVRVELYEN